MNIELNPNLNIILQMNNIDWTCFEIVSAHNVVLDLVVLVDFCRKTNVLTANGEVIDVLTPEFEDALLESEILTIANDLAKRFALTTD